MEGEKLRQREVSLCGFSMSLPWEDIKIIGGADGGRDGKGSDGENHVFEKR